MIMKVPQLVVIGQLGIELTNVDDIVDATTSGGMSLHIST